MPNNSLKRITRGSEMGDFKCCGGNDDTPKEHTMDCDEFTPDGKSKTPQQAAEEYARKMSGTIASSFKCDKAAFLAGVEWEKKRSQKLVEPLKYAEMMYRGAIRFAELNRSDDQSRYMKDLKDGQKLIIESLKEYKS